MTVKEPANAVNLRILGRVQGVGYRAFALDEARRLGLDGWVRNRRDGSVEALVAGPAGAVEAMIAACRAAPPPARVSDIQTTPAAPPAQAGFRQLPTE